VFRLGFDAGGEFAGQRIERRSQYFAPRDNHIVVSGLHCKSGMKTHRLFQPPPHAVPFDCIPVFFGNGEADARFCVRLVAIEGFNEEKAASALFSLAHGKKLRPAFQPPDSLFGSIIRHSPAISYRAYPALGRKTIAATGAAGNDDLAAALGSHTRTEAVATLANKLGWLIGTLHLF
jgi:hypothetical protein